MFSDSHDNEHLQAVFHALAHPVRRYLLGLLRVGGTTAGDLAASAATRFNISQSRVSQHLRVLADARLVDVSADGQHRFYLLREGAAHIVTHYVSWLDTLASDGRGAGRD